MKRGNRQLEPQSCRFRDQRMLPAQPLTASSSSASCALFSQYARHPQMLSLTNDLRMFWGSCPEKTLCSQTIRTPAKQSRILVVVFPEMDPLSWVVKRLDLNFRKWKLKTKGFPDDYNSTENFGNSTFWGLGYPGMSSGFGRAPFTESPIL